MREILQKIDVKIVIKLFLAAELFYGNMLVGIPFLLLLIPIGRYTKKEKIKAEISETGRQFADALNSIAFAVEVGYSMENAVAEAAKEMEKMYGKDASITTQLIKIQNKIAVNVSVEQAFLEMAEEVDNEDIKYFSHIFSLTKRSGGNLVSVLNNTARRINKKIEVKSEIMTIISGKKMEQNIMSAIPYVIIAYLRFSAPEFIVPLYGNLLGILIMTLCLAVCAGADFLADKILDIQV